MIKPATDAGVWIRASDDGQTTDNQIVPLEEFAKRRGDKIVTVYDISDVSAYQGQHHKFLDECIQDARQGMFRTLYVWSIDRLSREGIFATFEIIRRFDAAGCQVISLQDD